ncbi:MAG: TonB-dependent receptor, partial [Bacteroidota bacterium]
MKTTGLLLFTVLCLFADESNKPIGSISGTLVDGTTQEPLVGANVVVVELPSHGAVSGSDGSFTIKGLPVGEYSIRASLLGYQQAILTNVVVSTGRSTKIKIRMYEEAVRVGEVVVRADYFSSEGTIGAVSSMGLNGAEVKRSPGSVQDMQRIVQNLPGVANSNDQTNELIVRGGAPDENLTVMDYIEIPTTNHYPNQFNSGGPINMVNVDMIEDLRFSTGGFQANYGDKLSSVMDISLREGDKERTIAGEAGFNMAGIGTLLEGGWANGNGTWMLSARQSLLEFADKIVGLSAIGLTAIPKYYDVQVKTTYEISPTQKLIVNGIYGNDKILFKGKPEETNEQKKNITDSSGVETVDDKQHQYAAGISLKSLWGKDGYSVLSVYLLNNSYNVTVSEEFTRRVYDGQGKVLAYQPLSVYPVYKNNSEEQLLFLKYDAVWQLNNRHEINVGGRVGTNMKFKNEIFFNTDTIRFDFDRNGTWDDTS